MVNINMMFYFFAYYVTPAAIFIWLAEFALPEKGDFSKRRWGLFVGILVVLIFWIDITIVFKVLPDYLTAAIPFVLILAAVYLRKSTSVIKTRKLFVLGLTLTFVVSIFLPYVGAFAGYNGIIDQASSIADQEQQVTFVSNTALTITGNAWVIQGLVRAYDDFSKFLLSGGGACGETSIWEVETLKKLGFNARKVGLPGEDHSFVEVKLNGTWKIIDPGYGMFLVSRMERSERRVQEAGTISYVVAYMENGFVELTSEYVKTDTIVVRITQDGEPLVGASVTFVHTLVTDGFSRRSELPGNGFSFHTDINGTVTAHIGLLGENVYNNSFVETDPYYLVYVNGEPTPTPLRVTSTGRGIVKVVETDLAEV